MINQISILLRQMGVSRKYTGFRMICSAINLAIQDDSRLYSIGKNIYAPIAVEYSTSALNVERNIRTVIDTFWVNGNRSMLNEIAGYPILFRPSPTEFIDLIASYIERTNK